MGRLRSLAGVVALAVLMAVVVAAGAIFIAGRGDDDDPEDPAGTVADVSRAGTGELATADGVALLPTPDEVEDLAGADVTGMNLEMLEVAFDEGFWVGSGPRERLFVESDLDARDGGSAPQVGARVDVEGTLREPPDDAARQLRLSREDARELDRLGVLVEADRVTPAS